MMRLTLALAFVVSTPIVAQAADGDPSAFVTIGTNLDRKAIAYRETITRENRLVAAPWPFPTSSIQIACALHGWNVVKVGQKYASTNGSTSTLSERFEIVETSGRHVPIISISVGRVILTEGIVGSEAGLDAFGDWRSVLNDKLLAACP